MRNYLNFSKLSLIILHPTQCPYVHLFGKCCTRGRCHVWDLLVPLLPPPPLSLLLLPPPSRTPLPPHTYAPALLHCLLPGQAAALFHSSQGLVGRCLLPHLLLECGKPPLSPSPVNVL